MQVFSSVSALRTFLRSARSAGRSVGFVPTMGALHRGHLSLVRAARATSDVTVASIFVNPTQFNDVADLEKYPRTETQDRQLLSAEGCDALFLPSVEAVYPQGTHVSEPIDLNGLDEPMEGAHRPGHFAGVVQVVERLLRIVAPDHLFMGQKDFQQTAIVRRLIDVRGMDIDLRIEPTVREADGLAMSSRNVRLTETNRRNAPHLYRTLKRIKNLKTVLSPPELERQALWTLADHGFRPEYCKIVDGTTLRELAAFDESDSPVVCTAVWAGDIRLIDNIFL